MRTQAVEADPRQRRAETPDQPRGIPIYADEQSSVVDDPAGAYSSVAWFAGDRVTRKLVTCLESVRTVKEVLTFIESGNTPADDKRRVKLLVTPLYSLAVDVRRLCNDLTGNSTELSRVPAKDWKAVRDHLQRFGREVPTEKGSAFTRARNQLSSHVDAELFDGNARTLWDLVDLDRCLRWFTEAIVLLLHLLSLDAYAWTREGPEPGSMSLMITDGIEGQFRHDPPVAIGVRIARSPKYAIERDIAETTAIADRICVKVGLSSS